MGTTVVVALISAFVSLIVAYFTARYKFIADCHILEGQLNQRHLERIYGLRLDQYSKAFEITESIRKVSTDKGGINPRDELLDKRMQLWNWKTGSVSLILSKSSIDAFYKLVHILGNPCENARENIYSEAQIEKIFAARNAFRKALRNDIGLSSAEEWLEAM